MSDSGRNNRTNKQPRRITDRLTAAGSDADTESQEGASANQPGAANVYPTRGGARSTSRRTRIPDELVPPATESAEHRERESSPSAVSESSSVRLEWDSSADVGSIPLTGSEGPSGRREYGPEAAYPVGISSLHRIALQLSSGSSGTSNLDTQLQPPTPTTLSTTSGSRDTHEAEGMKSNPYAETRPQPEPLHKAGSRTATFVKVSDIRHPSSSKAFGRSHSQEGDDHAKQRLGRGISKSMIELATGGMRSDQPILLQPSSISYLKNKSKREASSRDSVTTLLPSTGFDKGEKSEFEDDDDHHGRAHSTPSSSPVTAVSPMHSPVPSSNPETVPHSISNESSEQFHRPQRRDLLGRGRRKRGDSDPHKQESSDDMEPAAKLEADKEDSHLTHNRGVSEASTDWEYGSRSHTPNESSLSDWQHSGLTHSEVKYKKKKGKAIPAVTDGDNLGLYSLTVEVRSDPNMKKDVAKQEGVQHATPLIQQSRGVQTDDPIEMGPPSVPKKGDDRKSSGSATRVSRSIQTIDQMFELSRGKSGGASTDGIKTDSSFAERSSSHSGNKIRDSHIKHRSSKNEEDQRRKNARDDENSHRQKRHTDKNRHGARGYELGHDARRENKENRRGKGKLQEDNVESILEEFLAGDGSLFNLEDDDASLSSNDLSTTCLKIKELLKTEPFRGKLLELVYAHHLSHLRNLKADIRRARQMNKIVVHADELDIQDEKLEKRQYSSTSSNDLKLSEEYYNELERAVPSKLDMKYTKKHNMYYKVPEARSPPLKPRMVAKKKEYSEQGASSNPQVSSSSSGGTYSINDGRRNNGISPDESSSGSPAVPKTTRRTTAAVGAQTQEPTPVPIRPCESTSKQKLDRLQRTCDMITDLLVLNQGLDPLPQIQDSSLHIQTSDVKTGEHHSARASGGSKKHRDHDRGHSSVVRKTSKSKQSYSFFVSFPNCERYNYNGFQTHTMPDVYEKENVGPVGPVKSLQEVFQENHPDILARVKARQEIIQRIKKEREIRGKLKREYIQSHGHRNGEFSSLLNILPPKGPRVMTTREMKDLTNKHYQQLPEVREKKLLARMERERQTNRLVQQLYAKRVKQEALRGKVNLGLSKSVIRK